MRNYILGNDLWLLSCVLLSKNFQVPLEYCLSITGVLGWHTLFVLFQYTFITYQKESVLRGGGSDTKNYSMQLEVSVYCDGRFCLIFWFSICKCIFLVSLG